MIIMSKSQQDTYMYSEARTTTNQLVSVEERSVSLERTLATLASTGLVHMNLMSPV